MTTRATSPLHLLVVEDETLMRWALVQTLTHAGHDVLEAEDAAAARRIVSGRHAAIDVVLLDLWLPDSRDLSLLADVRRLSPRSAVVLMSVDCPPEMMDAARALGVSAVVPKPFDLGDIHRVVVAASASGSAH